MFDGPDWERDGQDWPNRAASRFIPAAGVRWHVQVTGDGPVALLVHGAAAGTHSWRGLMPRLAERFTVVAPDLPGHAFTAPLPPGRRSLAGTARALGSLLTTLDVSPALVVGHSAGAALLARMALDGDVAPRALVSVNGAFFPFPGISGPLSTTVARLLGANPLVPLFIAGGAQGGRFVERFLRGTGSTIDEHGTALYRRLAANPGHVSGALALMGDWDLAGLAGDLHRLPCALTLLVGERDGMVPPGDANRVRLRRPDARRVNLPGLGHLAHEEAPDAVAGHIEAAFETATPESPAPNQATR